jgi:peptidyl-prolyl cis-trans isomerase B (cyclophilin B)
LCVRLRSVESGPRAGKELRHLTSQCKQQNASQRKKPMRSKLVWPLCICIATLLYGCGETPKSLERKAQSGKYADLLAFARDNLQDSTKADLVLIAIQQLLSPGNTAQVGRIDIERMVTSDSVQIPSRLLRSLAASNQVIIDSLFLRSLRNSADNEKYDALVRSGKVYCDLSTGRMPSISSAVSFAQEIIDGTARKLQAQQVSDRLEDELKFVKTEPLKTQTLEAFMVANVGYGQYEIALRASNYWGRTPSDNHAVLFTKESSFQSKGWFTLRVRRLADSEVRLKEDFGSFNQTWPVYEEVTEKDIASNEKDLKSSAVKRDSLRWARSSATDEVLRISALKKQLAEALTGTHQGTQFDSKSALPQQRIPMTALSRWPSDYPVAGDSVAIISVSIQNEPAGDIVLGFFPDKAPNHVRNFKWIANHGAYDGLRFHRIVKGFVIQGGDPVGNGNGGPPWSVQAEFNSVHHKSGILSMARAQDPNSAGSQFFIMLCDAPQLDKTYTVFGKVLKGMEVVNRVASVPVGGAQNSWPEQDVIMTSVRIVPRSEAL